MTRFHPLLILLGLVLLGCGQRTTTRDTTYDPPEDRPPQVDVGQIESFPLGSPGNPVRCHMPAGQRAYLSRLRAPDGSRVDWERAGSVGVGPWKNILDLYEVQRGEETVDVFMDMHHPGHVEERAVPGFLIASRYSHELIRGEDGLLRRPGEDEPADGEVVDTHPDGGMWRRLQVEEGRIVGELEEFDRQGRLRSARYFEDGRPHGPYFEYDPEGNLLTEGRYIDGRAGGTWREYDDRGTLRREWQMVDGLPHGHERIYDGRGDLIKEIWSERGRIVRERVHRPERLR